MQSTTSAALCMEGPVARESTLEENQCLRSPTETPTSHAPSAPRFGKLATIIQWRSEIALSCSCQNVRVKKQSYDWTDDCCPRRDTKVKALPSKAIAAPNDSSLQAGGLPYKSTVCHKSTDCPFAVELNKSLHFRDFNLGFHKQYHMGRPLNIRKMHLCWQPHYQVQTLLRHCKVPSHEWFTVLILLMSQKHLFLGTMAASSETVQKVKSWSWKSTDSEHIHTKVKNKIKYLKVGPRFNWSIWLWSAVHMWQEKKMRLQYVETPLLQVNVCSREGKGEVWGHHYFSATN